MIQRDYFQRMIEEAAYVISRLMGLREAGRFEELEKNLEDAFAGWFPFDRSMILQTDPQELPALLMEAYGLQETQLTVLADLLREEAETWLAKGQTDRGQQLLRAGLSILQFLDGLDPDLYSFARVEKINRLNSRLEEF